MSRLAYWNGTASNFEIVATSNIGMRALGINPTSDFYTKFAAFPRRSVSDVNTIRYDPQQVTNSVTQTEIYGRFWFRPVSTPASDARIVTADWIGGVGHDNIRIAFTSSNTLTFSVWTGATHTAVFTSSALSLDTYYRVEYHFKAVAAGSTTFTCEAKVDGTALGSLNTQTYAGVTIGSSTTVVGENGGVACKYDIAEFGLDSANWLGNTRTSEIPLTGAGTYDQWTVDANRTYLAMSDYPYADNSGANGYATATSGNIVSWTLPSFSSMGITGNIRALRVHWYKNNGTAMQVLVRRNGVDTFYTPAGLSATYDSTLIDTTGWAYTDTIEVGFKATAAITQRVASCGVYVEHDTADPGAATGNMKVVTGTYTGTGVALAVDFADSDVAALQPDFISLMRTDLAIAHTWWWDSKNAIRKDVNSDSSLSFLVPVKGGFQLNANQATVNTAGGTYSYVAFFDSNNRGSERGGWAAVTTDDDVNVTMRNTSFVVEAMLAEHEANNSSLKSNSYLRGPGMTGDQSDAVNLGSVSFKADGIQSMGTGTFQAGTTLSYTQPGSNYIAFRTTQFGSNRLFATGTYTGNGGGSRVIPVSLSGHTPTFVLLGHNQAIARKIWQGGICKSISSGSIDALAITAVGADSFTVHSNLNTNTAVYTYFVFGSGLDYDPLTFGVTNVTPANGPTPGGTAVTVTGVGFAAGGTFSFGGSAATSVNILSATSATMVTSAHAAGLVTVTYTSPLSVVGTLTGTYTYLSPTITNVSPSLWDAVGGETITLTGTVFESGLTITVGGVAVTGVVWLSSTSATFVSNAHAEGLVTIVLTNPDTTTASATAQYGAHHTTAGQWQLMSFEMKARGEQTS